MATRDTVEITHFASCPNSMDPGVEICDCFKRLFNSDADTKPNLLLPSTPSTVFSRSTRTTRSSTGSTRSKRSLWSDDEESGSDSERDAKRAKTRSLLPFVSRVRSVGTIDAFIDPPGNLLVDKTESILNLPDKFQFLFLRPPQFGKTMFLSTLYHFYDFQGADQFDQRFGSLAVVTKAPTPVRHSQHLCLCFHFSDLPVCSYPANMASRLSNQISFVLNLFLIKYAKELKLDAPEEYLDDEGDLLAKFTKVFSLVRSHGHTLFVGVDDHDAPTRTLTLHVDHPIPDEPFATPQEVENLLDSLFWKPLMAASDVIDKLFVTGALLVNYPTLRSLATEAVPGLENVCGFTEEEALYFTQSLLDQVPDMTDLRRLCGNYIFSSQPAEVQSLLHPRLLLNRIFELSLPRPPIDNDSFELLSRILKTLPEEADAPGAVTLNGLIELLASGAVDFGGQPASSFDLAATQVVTWSALHFAGALTHGGDQSTGTFRIANDQVLSLIHSQVDGIVDERHELAFAFSPAWYHFSMSSDPEPLLELLVEVLRDLARRSCGKKNEPNLPGIFELVVRNSRCWRRNVDPIVLRPAENLHCIQIPAYQPENNLTLELKTLTLRGMWQATSPNDNEPTVEALKALHEELVNLREDELLARPYTAWSPILNAMETVRVGSFFDPEPSENPRFLAIGGAQILLRQRPRERI
ncbi:hypothetical protein C8R45DRAFT_1071531 [Mycena sanguinolenta]|nr:hypothetical protein C8R45DRAFT_1071531 [Mycena sanguinolenta]